ncbi:MAG: Mut7-C RNAse domain-containing protein [Candidatus Thorarchaeota archaeon]|nr:Mut7-C RNAse domain-containing protein [Candidatus Thorarchaeota archaeon]
MKFVVDAMLGKVALWLRLTGHDTIYYGNIDDDDALAIAEEEGRALLTADEELFQRANNRKLDGMLVREPSVEEKVASVFFWFDIQPKIDPSIARCSKCNGVLEEITADTKDRVKDHVFEKTYNTYDTFWQCNDCDSVFFQGGYWDNMMQYMERIRKLMKELKG